MFSARKVLYRKDGEQEPSSGVRKNARSFWHRKRRFRPRVSIRVWLTLLFVLVTAFAAVTAYEIVRPILENTLNQASQASFRQVGEQFEDRIARNDDVSVQSIRSFATSRGLQWGIVRVEGSGATKLQGDQDLEWDPSVVKAAVTGQQPREKISPVETGERAGQLQATYASPINDNDGQEGLAVVFNRFYTTSDVENVRAAVRNVERIVLLAGALALLISGFAGYVAATLISRRISRLGLAAERLAGGNFDERIDTRIEDEVGSLGATFNSMAASLKDAFEQVEQEKERGSAILDGMTDAVVGVDRDLNAIFLNPRARELLESAPHEFHNRLQEVLAKSRYSGLVTEPEAGAGNRIIEIRAAPLEDGALAILRDVTEEHDVQRAKAEFIANASHELKTPLFALSGYLEMLEDEEDEKVRTEFLEDMRAQTERLQNLARTLLDLSRLDANAVTFRLEEVDLEYLLHELRRDFGYTGRPLNIRTEEGVPPVETDPTQLHRVLAILLDNALKYSEQSAPVDLGLSRENGHAVISVTDRGCGIPEPEQAHIFDRFYRAQGSSRADGTGLGLALADEISHHLGGEIRVHSKPDIGSTFSLSLPLSTKEKDSEEPLDEAR